MSHATPHGRTAGIDPEYQYDAERGLSDGTPPRQPPGLWVLFITEMWERFSYYGMRAILVLFLYTTTAEILADGVANENPGFGWSRENAYTLYGLYAFMVYLGGILGGIAADRALGTHRSVVLGGWVIALGHITLAISGVPPKSALMVCQITRILLSSVGPPNTRPSDERVIRLRVR